MNCYHPTIKFIANYLREEINFLDVSVRKKISTCHCFIYKPKDTHQHLHASSCHVYYSLRLNKICSENSFCYKRCNGLEVWLRGWGYSDKLVRQQVLKARKHKRKHLFNDKENKRNVYRLLLNITCHPNFSNLKDTMPFLHLLLTSDQKHQKLSHKGSITGFRKAKSLKDILVRVKVSAV